MIRRATTLLAAMLATTMIAAPALADAAPRQQPAAASLIERPSAAERARYTDILSMLSARRWDEARTAIQALDAGDSMRAYLLAQLYTAAGSPKVELFDLLDLLNKAPYLAETEQIGRLATLRGAQVLPNRPAERQLLWAGAAPQRRILRAVAGDSLADSMRGQILQYIKDDRPSDAAALLAGADASLLPEARTELRQRVAWSYYICGDTTSARRLAEQAAQGGTGPFLAAAYWVQGLAAWRERQYDAAANAFYQSAVNADDADRRSGGYYWAARAMMADRHPERVDAMLRAAARDEESFYGMLARETLGLGPSAAFAREHVSAQDWSRLAARPNVRNAVILASLGRTSSADEVLRHEATLSGDANYNALIHLASDLSLPTTQLWLAHRSPSGQRAPAYARYPRPDWTPTNGWKVDRALVFAHALQESRFQTDAHSAADARGVMQVRAGTGGELAAQAGMAYSSADQLYDPATNLALGQLYLEKLARMDATGGLLPKVVAAYNAGPLPISRWNVQVRDEGDPLLFIESVPYYETRAYLNAVLRNYWIYQIDDQGRSPALAAMAQGMWTRFPERGETVAVRMAPAGVSYGAN